MSLIEKRENSLNVENILKSVKMEQKITIFHKTILKLNSTGIIKKLLLILNVDSYGNETHNMEFFIYAKHFSKNYISQAF